MKDPKRKGRKYRGKNKGRTADINVNWDKRKRPKIINKRT